MRIPRLMAISRRERLAGGLGDWLEAVARAGVEAVQLREKDLGDLELYRLARDARARVGSATLLTINGRADVALAVGAAGVHLPSRGLPEAAVRRLLGPDALIGRSCHSRADVERAVRQGADYALLGPVFASPGKGRALGLGELAGAAAVGLPLLALGGITIDRLAAVAEAGARGAAGIRVFLDRERLPELVRRAAEVFER